MWTFDVFNNVLDDLQLLNYALYVNKPNGGGEIGYYISSSNVIISYLFSYENN